MSGDPNPVARSVDALRRQFALAPSDDLDRVRRRWAEVLGERQAALSRPVGIRDGVLSVVAQDPAVVEALRWSEARLVAALGGGPEAVELRGVRAVVGRDTEG